MVRRTSACAWVHVLLCIEHSQWSKNLSPGLEDGFTLHRTCVRFHWTIERLQRTRSNVSAERVLWLINYDLSPQNICFGPLNVLHGA